MLKNLKGGYSAKMAVSTAVAAAAGAAAASRARETREACENLCGQYISDVGSSVTFSLLGIWIISLTAVAIVLFVLWRLLR